eukprot:SAG31_NODE_4893_length_2881_cov_1.559310_3_plen_208_part_00
MVVSVSESRSNAALNANFFFGVENSGIGYIGDAIEPHRALVWVVAEKLMVQSAQNYAIAVTRFVVHLQRSARGMAGRAKTHRLRCHCAATTLQSVARVMQPQYERRRLRRLHAAQHLQRFYKRRIVWRRWQTVEPMMVLRRVRVVLRLQRRFRDRKAAEAAALAARRARFKLAKLLKRVGLVPRVAAYNRLPLDLRCCQAKLRKMVR